MIKIANSIFWNWPNSKFVQFSMSKIKKNWNFRPLRFFENWKFDNFDCSVQIILMHKIVSKRHFWVETPCISFEIWLVRFLSILKSAHPSNVSGFPKWRLWQKKLFYSLVNVTFMGIKYLFVDFQLRLCFTVWKFKNFLPLRFYVKLKL